LVAHDLDWAGVSEASRASDAKSSGLKLGRLSATDSLGSTRIKPEPWKSVARNENNSVIPSKEDRSRSGRSSQSRDLLLAGVPVLQTNNRSLHAPDDSRSESSGLVGMTKILWHEGKGVNQLQFKIKDQDYFLAFVEDEKRWYVFAPTAQGVHRIPVYVDAAKYEKSGMLGIETTLTS
jgi:hypothetical protein